MPQPNEVVIYQSAPGVRVRALVVRCHKWENGVLACDLAYVDAESQKVIIAQRVARQKPNLATEHFFFEGEQLAGDPQIKPAEVRIPIAGFEDSQPRNRYSPIFVSDGPSDGIPSQAKKAAR